LCSILIATGARAAYGFFEFYTAQIRNPKTCRVYARVPSVQVQPQGTSGLAWPERKFKKLQGENLILLQNLARTKSPVRTLHRHAKVH